MPGGIRPPIEVIAAWPTPNYAHPATRPKGMLIAACILGPLSLAFLAARLWAPIRIQRNAGLDDWLMVVAMVPLMAYTIILTLACDFYGINRHVWDNDPVVYPTQLKYTLMVTTVFCVAAGLIKISILLFYRRLSANAVTRRFYWFNMSYIALVAAYTVAFTIVPLTGCKPFNAFWDQLNLVKIAGGFEYKCFDLGANTVAAAIVSAVQDFFTALIPTFVYWNPRVPIRQKVIVFGIFAIGYGVVVMGSMRAYKTWVLFYQSYDMTWYAWEVFFWSLLELHIGAMCANAPALKVFLAHYLQSEETHKPRERISSDRFLYFSSRLQGLSFWKDSSTQKKRGLLKFFRDAPNQSHDASGLNDQIQISPHLGEANNNADWDVEKNSLSSLRF